MGILVYAIPALFPAVFIDLLLTVYFRGRSKYALSAFTTIPTYLLLAFCSTLILSKTDDTFSGQGAIGLGLILGFGLILSILRAILELVLFIRTRRK